MITYTNKLVKDIAQQRGCSMEEIEGEILEGYVMKNNKWIDWSGGECPVGRNTQVTVELRGGGQVTCKACGIGWAHNDPDSDDARADVVAYMESGQFPNEPEVLEPTPEKVSSTQSILEEREETY